MTLKKRSTTKSNILAKVNIQLKHATKYSLKHYTMHFLLILVFGHSKMN